MAEVRFIHLSNPFGLEFYKGYLMTQQKAEGIGHHMKDNGRKWKKLLAMKLVTQIQINKVFIIMLNSLFIAIKVYRLIILFLILKPAE